MNDGTLAPRIRAALGDTETIGEMKMFGGVCFTLGGHMLAAASQTRGLLLRLGRDATQAALRRPKTRPMEMRGRVMADYLYVDPEGLSEDALRAWIADALAFVRTLPPKPARPSREASKRRG